MNLIDRYVYAVAQYLPKDVREDIQKELRANIEDMLPENYTEKDVYQVLEELGNPMELANEYNPKKRYLIGPGYFDKYIAILKMVVGICIAVSVGISILVAVVNPSDADITTRVVEIFTSVITGALVAAVQGTFWVTIIFVILERSGVETGHYPFYGEKWTPESLPEITPSDRLKISRGETAFSMICTIVFTAVLYLQPQLIAVYSKGEEGIVNSTSLFNVSRLKVYMIIIFILAVVQLGVFVWKYVKERWNLPLIICDAVYNVMLCILVVTMLSDSALFNAEFVPAIAALTKGPMNTIALWFDRGKIIFAAFFIAICAWDSIATFYKYVAHKKNQI